ncbi:MAG: glycosyltransferase family 2 protein [Solirubrobacterales bacterium]
MAAATLGAVICAYSDERRNELVRSIESLLTQSRPLDRIVLVIDHNDGLLDHATELFADRGVTVVANHAKQGLSGARNSGVAVIDTDVIAFLDDDAEAAKDWSQRIGSAYADPSVIGAGGAVIPRWQSKRPSWFPEEFLWVVGCTYRGLPTEMADVRNLIGANMSLRSDVFVRAGHFSTDVGRVGKKPVGCEETELCIRALAAIDPSHIIYDPTARVTHLVTTERATWRYFRQRCFMEGISKAQVVRMAGAGQGLSSERSYSTKVLPLGVLRGLGDVFRGRPSGITRAMAICAGLLITTAGFIRGRLAPQVLEPLPTTTKKSEHEE